MRVAVISLKRTPERWSAFLQRNRNALTDCEILRIDGIDGIEILNSNIKSKLIPPSANQGGARELLVLALATSSAGDCAATACHHL